MIKSSLFMIVCLFSLSVFSAGKFSVEEKLSDFNQLLSMIKTSYGPLEYKITAINMDYEKLNEKYRQKIIETKSNRDFYYTIVQYVAEYKDGHFGGRLPTDFESSLPIATELIDGRVLIENIDREKLSEEDFPFSMGDEIVEIDGQSISAVLDEIQKYVSSGYDQSVRRFAAWQVFYRRAERMPAPTGKIRVSVRRGTSKVIEEVELEWETEGEALDEDYGFFNKSMNYFARGRLDYDLISSRYVRKFEHPSMARKFMCSGDTRVDIPKDATIIMEEPFVAYYHPTEKGNIGYLRIPHYSPRDEHDQRSEAETKKRFSQYEYAVWKLEQNTVGLIIDQDHNCGGSVRYLEHILGLFMNEPYMPMLFQLRGSKAEYLNLKEWQLESGENTLQNHYYDDVLALIKKAWKNGNYLTEKTTICGNGLYQPNAVHYTKPIIVLIDELSGSGGDAFPALMKGYGRAKLLGTRTSGLGGHVERLPSLFYSQIKLRITKSLFFRPDGVPVENNGAVPDINYSITRDDFLYGYREYQEFYLDAIEKMIP